MFLEEILIYNQDFPKMQKMTQRKTSTTQLCCQAFTQMGILHLQRKKM